MMCDSYCILATPIIGLYEVKLPYDHQFDDLSEEKINGVGNAGS